MSPKRRTRDKHLPPNIYYKHGAFFWVRRIDNKKKWIRLGKTLHEALAVWAKLIDCSKRVRKIADLFDRYMIEVAPLKKPITYRGNVQQIKYLRLVFDELKPEEITPVDIYKYLDIRGKLAPISANREKMLLSHIFSKAIQWGIMRDNPCRHVKRLPEKPRDRYIEDWEYIAVKNIAPEFLKNVMDFAYLTGQRLSDILNVKISDLTEVGIKIEQSKTGKKLLIEWSEKLKECVIRARNIFKYIASMYLFSTRKGTPYTRDGFSTIWQRTMKKAILNKLIQERFTFHDIRAKASTDIKDRGNASALLGHADPRITERIYNRKAKKVQPTR